MTCAAFGGLPYYHVNSGHYGVDHNTVLASELPICHYGISGRLVQVPSTSFQKFRSDRESVCDDWNVDRLKVDLQRKDVHRLLFGPNDERNDVCE